MKKLFKKKKILKKNLKFKFWKASKILLKEMMKKLLIMKKF